MKPLDSFSFPLSEASLIEASAGTGKTYTIVNLVLRLLIGHNCKPLSIDQILVVTFTNAATSELKDRIRKRIHSAYLDFYQQRSEEHFIVQLIDDIDDIELICERLTLAMKQLDEASIFTIHSYCQRILTQYAFESGSTYDEKLELDDSKWVTQAVYDYWRKSIVPLAENELAQINLFWRDPEALQKSLIPYLAQQLPSVQTDSILSAQGSLEELKNATLAMKNWWSKSDVSSALQAAKLKKNTKLGKVDIYLKMDAFCLSDKLASPFEKTSWADLFPAKVASARSKASPDLADFDFRRFEHLESLQKAVQEKFIKAYFSHALKCVKDNLLKHKQAHSLLAPDDLLTRLQSALVRDGGSHLAKLIRDAYPAALIDEFQDTDSIQFDIFSQIYLTQTDSNESSPCLIMIGDPKQAIYGFRGADIYTYLRAKQQIDEQRQYTLSQNWRSQKQLVEATNALFSNSESGFLFDDEIPFIEVTAAKPEASVLCSGNKISSLKITHLIDENDVVANKVAQQSLAENMAEELVGLISTGRVISDGVSDRKVQAGDCCVLVRDRLEAGVVKQFLSGANVASVFLSRESVFASRVSQDLYLILSAIAAPTEERKLKAAILTSILDHSASHVEALFSDDELWQQTIDQFFHWHQLWQRYGVMNTVNSVMRKFDVFDKAAELSDAEGLRKITDLRHLTELLQQQSENISGENQLLHWFAQQISDPDHRNDTQQLRLETDANLVQIITMHASKGLEFPFVFIPFACAHRPTKTAIFHDKNQHTVADFSNDPDNLEIADRERLAEDIRLLYVAITRAVYHCSIGIWNPPIVSRSKQSGLFKTALGSLVLKSSDDPDNHILAARIKHLAQIADIDYSSISTASNGTKIELKLAQVESTDTYSAAYLPRRIVRDWQLTSYSAIASQQDPLEYDLIDSDKPGRDERGNAEEPDADVETEELVELTLSRFTFTKGAQAGLFLHGVLENLCFTDLEHLDALILQQGQWYGIEQIWYPTVADWMLDAIKTPMSKNGLSLEQLSPRQMLAEMEFHIPLKSVEVAQFNQIVNQSFKTVTRQYGFEKLTGMLKGFIDLTFEFEGRFYVADYKSNFLGSDFSDYDEEGMGEAMVEHDYHLQSLLYIVALHRYLKVSLPHYDYNKHVGGAYYLFLRGMSVESPDTGCYFSLPEHQYVIAMDKLFSNETQNSDSDASSQMDLW